MILRELKDMLRGKEGPIEEAFERQADMCEWPESAFYRHLALLHRRITVLMRVILCMTIALLAMSLGDIMRGIAFVMERFG